MIPMLLRGGPAVALDGHVDEVVHQQVGLVGEGVAVVALRQVEATLLHVLVLQECFQFNIRHSYMNVKRLQCGSRQADQSPYTNCKGVCDIIIFRSFAGIIPTSRMNRQPQIYENFTKPFAIEVANYIAN